MLLASHELDHARPLADPRGRASPAGPAPHARSGVERRVADRDDGGRREPLAGGRGWSRARTCGSRRRTRVTAAADPAVRPDRAAPVRVRARPRPRASCAGSRPACSGSRCCSPRCSRSSRSFAIEADNGARDGLRLSGLDGPAIFLGKAAAIAVQLLALEVVLAARVVLLYGVELNTLVPLVLATLAATVGLAATGTLYGVLAAGLRVRETLVPLLVLPVVAPVLLGATRAWEAAIDGIPSDAWPWVGAARGVRGAVHGDRDAGLRAAAGGIVSERARRDEAAQAAGRAGCSAGLTLVSVVVLVLFGLWGAPPDEVQGDAQRLMYLHVPAAWVAYLAFGVTALGRRCGCGPAPGPTSGTASPARRPSWA